MGKKDVKEKEIKFKVIYNGTETTDVDGLKIELINLCYDYGFDVELL